MRRLWHWGWAAVGIGALALSLRLVHAFQMSASPLFTMPAVDAATYAEQAASLASGNWLGRGQGPFWQPPLYPYFLGVIKLAFSESFYYVSRFAQALIGSLTCVLLYLGRAAAFWVWRWFYRRPHCGGVRAADLF